MSLNAKHFTFQMFSYRVLLERAEEAKPKLGDKSPKYLVNLLYELFSTRTTSSRVVIIEKPNGFQHNNLHNS